MRSATTPPSGSPTSPSPNAQRDNTTEWISDQSITDLIAVLPARHVLIVADSCYSGAMTRSTGVGLISKGGNQAQVQRLVKLAKLPSRTVLTSGGEQPVLDAGGGGHSIFARVFLQVLRSNDRVMEGSAVYGALFDEVRGSAARYKVNQEPRYSQIADAGHLNGEFAPAEWWLAGRVRCMSAARYGRA